MKMIKGYKKFIYCFLKTCAILTGVSMDLLENKCGSNDEKYIKNQSILRQVELGQYMTPAPVAEFMSSLFCTSDNKNIRLLDAGAGFGALTSAFFSTFSKKNVYDSVEVSAWEVDYQVQDDLQRTLNLLQINLKKEQQIDLLINLYCSDFISDAVFIIRENKYKKFTHAILNPPYKKIKCNSQHSILLKEVGIEVTNYYSAFLALAIHLMEDNGQIVAIVPRSFCNGLYHKAFRKLLLKNCAIKQIHLFESRKDVFKNDHVLQENIVIYLEKNAIQKDVIVSTSYDSTLKDYQSEVLSFDNIVNQDDPELFIRIPIKSLAYSPLYNQTLSQLSLQVSTGPVVDFRVRQLLSQNFEKNTVPLIYPHHFSSGALVYPKESKKPNAIILNEFSKKLLMPSGYYVLVKRITSKEERKRVVAYVISPLELESSYFAFENHWNIFHNDKQGLDRDLAYGLATILNSTAFENFFRSFSGNTQVNATDLRAMKYPSIDLLTTLGKIVSTLNLNQDQVDEYIEATINKISCGNSL